MNREQIIKIMRTGNEKEIAEAIQAATGERKQEIIEMVRSVVEDDHPLLAAEKGSRAARLPTTGCG